MVEQDILEFYDEIGGELRFLSTSGVRIKIMVSLIEGPKKTKKLREEIGLSSSSILHGMSELEKQNLILRDGNDYLLSQMGKIMALKLVDMIKMVFTVKKHEKLWLDHEIDDIPRDLILSMGDLNDAVLVESELTDIFKPLENFSQLLLESKEVKGISPIFNPDFIETFSDMVDKGIKVELILTDEIIKKMMETLDPVTLMDLMGLISEEKIKIWKIDKDIKVAFTVTDKFISLGLFSTKGEYDPSKDLISQDPDAIGWGHRLFNYYCKQADRLNL